jgi:hypothetical protein
MTHAGNIPVPAGPRAPVTPGWFFRTAPFAAVIAAYRLVPASRRAGWNRNNGGLSTSHEAMAAVLAPGGGWKAFRHYATPRFAGRRQYGFAMAWTVLLLSVAAHGIQHDHGVSWAN